MIEARAFCIVKSNIYSIGELSTKRIPIAVCSQIDEGFVAWCLDNNIRYCEPGQCDIGKLLTMNLPILSLSIYVANILLCSNSSTSFTPTTHRFVCDIRLKQIVRNEQRAPRNSQLIAIRARFKYTAHRQNTPRTHTHTHTRTERKLARPRIWHAIFTANRVWGLALAKYLAT